jgi:hypothetical protein
LDHPHKIRQQAGTHLLLNGSALNFYRDLTDAQLQSNFLLRLPENDQRTVAFLASLETRCAPMAAPSSKNATSA